MLKQDFNFTFHNVSINTAISLLSMTKTACFTFHNVSINTPEKKFFSESQASLHSTMFLLIRSLFV